MVDLSCFASGTSVRTNSNYVSVDKLKNGDKVVTDERSCVRIRKVSEFNSMLYLLKADPILDLYCNNTAKFEIISEIKVPYVKEIPTKCSMSENIKVKWEVARCPSIVRQKKYNELEVNKDYIGIPIPETNAITDLKDKELFIIGLYMAGTSKDRKNFIIRVSKYLYRKSIFKQLRNEYRCEYYENCVVLKLKHNSRMKNFILQFKLNKTFNNILNIGPTKLQFILNGLQYSSSARNERHIIYTKKLIEKEYERLKKKTRLKRKELRANGYIPNKPLKSEVKKPVIKFKHNVYKTVFKTKERELAEMLVLAIQKAYRTSCKLSSENGIYIVVFGKRFDIVEVYKESNVFWYPIRGLQKSDKVQELYNIHLKKRANYTVNNCLISNDIEKGYSNGII